MVGAACCFLAGSIAARLLVFLEGTNSHDYKFSSAALERATRSVDFN